MRSETLPRRRGYRAASTRRRAALLAAVLVTPSPAVAAPDPVPDPHVPCPLCRADLDVPVVRWTAAQLDSLAADHAAFNERRIARIDSLLQSGVWGPPGSGDARRQAHLVARLSLVNAYSDLARWAGSPDRVHEIDGVAMEGIYRRYTDVNLFMGPRLATLRIGMGRVCARYSVEEPGEGESWHGGRKIRWQVRGAKIDGRKRRVVDVKVPTGQDGHVRFLFTAHHTMAVSHERIGEGPSSFEWFLVHDIEGAWVRKWGTHRPTAYMFWTASPDREGGPPTTGPTPERPSPEPVALAGFAPVLGKEVHSGTTARVGVRLYVPGLRLRLPVLPDIGIDDLREADLIMPVLDLRYLLGGEVPSWLEPDETLSFRDWKGSGAVPEEIRRRFPDR